MPKLSIPFLIKPDVVSKHKISHVCLLLERNKIITGSFNGDLIIWQILDDRKSMDPKVFLTPCLNQSVGKVSCMTILSRPLQFISDDCEHCLITIHLDNRIRLWDINDGRCFNISAHNIFNDDDEITRIELLTSSECRYLACIGRSGNLHIADIWKLRVVKTIKISQANLCAFKIDKENKEFVILDSSNSLIFWDLKDYFSNEINQYFEYIENNESNAVRTTILLKDITRKIVVLPGALSEPPLDFLFDRNLRLFLVVYRSKIVIYDKNELAQGKVQSYMSLTYTNHKQLQNIFKLNHYETTFVLIITKTGNMLALDYEDLLFLWKLQEKITDDEINFSYTDFSFFKEKNANNTSLTLHGLNLLYLIDLKKEVKSLSGSFNLSAFDQLTNTLVIYNPIDHFIRFYNTSREIEHFKNRIRLLSRSEDEEETKDKDYKLIKSRNSVLSLIEKNVNVTNQEGLLGDPSDRQNVFEPFLIFLVKNRNLKNESCYLRYWFSHFFNSQFNNDDINVFEKEELISISTLAFVRNKELMYILGTNKGKVYMFPVFFEVQNPKYKFYIYQLNDDKSPINILYHKKDTLLFSNSSGRFIALELNGGYLAQKEAEVAKSQTHKKLIPIDLTPLKKADQFLLNPIKRILQVKQILSDAWKENCSLILLKTEESSLYFEQCLALVLENNSIAIFSLKTNAIDYILKANEGAVLGVFFHSTFDQIFVLNSTGDINIWSISTGNFERTLPYKTYYHHFNLKELINQHSVAFENHHNYNSFKTVNSKSISKLHTVLEFNMRGDEKLIDYDHEASNKAHRTFQLNNERFGDLGRIVFSEKEGANLIWMLNYANDVLFESKSKQNGCACLKLKLSTSKLETQSEVGHILLIDCKRNLENFRKFFETKESKENYLKSYLNILPLVFPFGVVPKIDQKIFKKIDNKLPVFNFCLGTQGMGESFSFLLRSEDSWNTSGFLSTIQALAITFYFLTNTAINTHSSIRLIEKTLDLLCKKENKTKIHPNFKSLSLKLLSRFCVDDNNEIMSSACNLIVASLMNFEGDVNELCSIPFNLFLSNLNSMEQNQNNSLLSRLEVIWIMLTGYSFISLKPNVENNLEVILKRILTTIDIKNCLLNPNYVIPCLKLFIDGIKIWKSLINKINDFLTTLLLIYFNYAEIELTPELNVMISSKPAIVQMLNEFEKQDGETRKRMKKMLLLTIQSIAINYINDFVSVLKREVQNMELSPLYPCSIIEIIRNLVKSQFDCFQSHLHILVEIILKSLESTNVTLRKHYHKYATHALHAIVKIYPTVAFNQMNQFYATSTNENAINIYDLRSATKAKSITGIETTPIAIGFDSSGKYLAVFSLEDSVVRIFQTGGGGIIGTIFGWKSSQMKTINVPRKSIDYESLKKGYKIRLSWSENDRQVTLNFGENAQINLDVQPEENPISVLSIEKLRQELAEMKK